MKQTLNSSDFHREFEAYGRADQFSYQGLDALFEYLEEFEDSTGEEMDLDVIGLCCDFTEYDTAQEAAEQTVDMDTHDVDDDTTEEEYVEILQDEVSVIAVPNGRVIVHQ